ncbi:ATP-binding protein [Trichlorobacter lovleyi]|uniref:ATP-binding protein n=1 Tax=Trichlorobacter lovleyi TaxID=313985 RepID=UPI0024803D88|nr:ATP-binding protein [Trichlorobacter lovleyi]
METNEKIILPEQDELNPTFGDNFLIHHAGKIITDPTFAIVELVANCWDAGATTVNIEWPEKIGDTLSVEDNGTGMTKSEFGQRWMQLNYNRHANQGPNVEFPKGGIKKKRVAFGRNGIGRHGMFCFGEDYHLETCKDGILLKYHITTSTGKQPFKARPEGSEKADGHGTRLYTNATKIGIEQDKLIELIGSRFVTDPAFKLYVNTRQVTLTDLEHLCEKKDLPVDNIGTVTIRRFDSEKTGRLSKHHGVAWWVNRRLVGIPSWDVYDNILLDSRTATAKRFTYVVEADFLLNYTKADWSDFHSSDTVNKTRSSVFEYIRDDLKGLMHDFRKERKKAALEASRGDIKGLSTLSQEHVAAFADEIQVRCPTISPRDLENAVSVLAKLEKTRSGYSLLSKLATYDHSDIEALNAILDEWSAVDAKKVLDELKYRLELIKQLEELVENHDADELHDLQPLFERGLWIFGPEFESISFTSNRSLSTVVNELLGGAELATPRKRPDFVVLPDSSIGVYSCDAYDSRHEVCGLASVVIVELKRGGFEVTSDEKDQAMKYAREIRKSGKVGRDTRITCYVLGASVEPTAEEQFIEGNTVIIPRRYNTILGQAHARTFNLMKKIETNKNVKLADEDLFEIIYPEQEDLLQALT